MKQLGVLGSLDAGTEKRIRSSLPSFMADRDTCTISRFPTSGTLRYWVTTFKCPCHGKCQVKTYRKQDGSSTPQSYAADTAQKIERDHSACYAAQTKEQPATGYSKEFSMVDDAIDLAKTYEERNRDLEAQVSAAMLGSSQGSACRVVPGTKRSEAKTTGCC